MSWQKNGIDGDKPKMLILSQLSIIFYQESIDSFETVFYFSTVDT